MQIKTICKRTKHLTMLEMPLKARIIHRRMSGNPHFPDAGEMLAELDACRAAMEEANQRCVFHGGILPTAHRRACRAALDAALDSLFHYVRAASRGNVEVALSSGFTLRKPPLLVPVPGAPQGVHLRRDRESAALQLRWTPMHGARLYIVEVKEGDINDTSGWRLLKMISEAKLHLEGLEPGVYYGLRVRASFAAGLSPYSNCVRGMAA